MSALLRLIHNASCSQTYGSIVAQGHPLELPEQASRRTEMMGDQARSVVAWARASISRWVRRMLHHSLCSAIGIPHSTQIRTR